MSTSRRTPPNPSANRRGHGAAVIVAALLLGPLAAGGFALGGCKGRERERQGDEGSRVKEAFEKFIDFGMSNESYDLGRRDAREPPAKVRRRAVNSGMAPRLRLELDIELPYDLSGAALERTLLENARRALAGSDAQAVRVRAWPGPLERFAGTMGYAVVATDGQGWDGERLGYREVKVTLGDPAMRPGPFEYKILCALEEEAKKLEAGLTGKGPEARGGASAKGRQAAARARVAKVRTEAEARVAAALKLDLATVRKAIEKAEAYYLRE